MIEVEMNGQVRGRRSLELFANRVINSFFTKRYRRHVYVEIFFEKRVENNYLGICYPNDNRTVTICIARQDDDGNYFDPADMAKVLAHELVHAKQYFKRQFDFCSKYRAKSTEPYVTYNGVSYYDAPWEIEAINHEESLFDRFWNET